MGMLIELLLSRVLKEIFLWLHIRQRTEDILISRDTKDKRNTGGKRYSRAVKSQGKKMDWCVLHIQLKS